MVVAVDGRFINFFKGLSTVLSGQNNFMQPGINLRRHESYLQGKLFPWGDMRAKRSHLYRRVFPRGRLHLRLRHRPETLA